MTLFLEHTPSLLASMRAAIAQGDPETLVLAAHSLRGSAANLGSASVSQAAFELERMGRDGNLARGKEALADLEKTMEHFTPALSSLL